DVPHLRRMPVILYVWDRFTRPCPLRPDIVVDIDPVAETKLEALHQHTSQVYEWLPYNVGLEHEVPEGDDARLAWLRQRYMDRDRQRADQFRDKLIARYGEERGKAVVHAETVEISEYGAPLTESDEERLFPF
ncbi:MAG: PIG-L family deacetylase, partial [Anaerolineae bacterium]